MLRVSSRAECRCANREKCNHHGNPGREDDANRSEHDSKDPECARAGRDDWGWSIRDSRFKPAQAEPALHGTDLVLAPALWTGT